MNPLICRLTAAMLPEIWSSARLWLCNSTSSALLSATRRTIWSLRSDNTVVALLALAKQISQLRVAVIERL